MIDVVPMSFNLEDLCWEYFFQAIESWEAALDRGTCGPWQTCILCWWGCFWNSDAMKKPEGSRGHRDQLNLTLQKLGYLSTSSPNPATVAPLGCAFEFSSVANKLLKYSSDILVMYPSYSRFWSALDLILLVRFSTPRKAHGLVGPIFMLGPFARGLSNTPVPAPACHPYHRSCSISSISPPLPWKSQVLWLHIWKGKTKHVTGRVPKNR